MSAWGDILSKVGLEEMIDDECNNIAKLEKDYIAVEKGLLYNPLCKEENMREIKKIIAEKEQLIVELQEALIIKK